MRIRPHWNGMPVIASLFGAVFLLGGCDDGSDPSASADDSTGAVVTPAAHRHDGDETCYLCDSSQRDVGRLWCREHSRYEDRCWIFQPQLEDASRPYCKEHFLYEDECFLCDPSRAPSTRARGERYLPLALCGTWATCSSASACERSFR